MNSYFITTAEVYFRHECMSDPLALWEAGLRKWLEKRSAKDAPKKRPEVTINR